MVNSTFPPLERPTLDQVKKLDEVPIGCGFRGRVISVQLSQRNTPALFGAKLIDELPDSVILAQERQQKLRWRNRDGISQSAPVGRASILPDGRVGKFGWKAQSSSLLSFVQAACANELGLGNPGQAQPVPLSQVNYVPRGLDLTAEQCDQMTAFIAALSRPVQQVPDGPEGKAIIRGKAHFNAIGCAECHVPDMGSIAGVYSDFLLHRMGDKLEGGGSYNPPPPEPDSPGNDPFPDEWRTPPLWGVADSAPYLHDGRAPTLEEAIIQHGGQAGDSARQFRTLSPREQADMIMFLKSLRAPAAPLPAAPAPI